MSTEAITQISVRVYALIVENGHILLAEEFHFGRRICKLPGGGLEPGEGTLDCLRREALEEFGQAIEPQAHFYTTDFCQPAIGRPGVQVLSIYYLAKFSEPLRLRTNTTAYEHCPERDGSYSFRWVALSEFTPELLTLPIDKHVAALYQQKQQ